MPPDTTIAATTTSVASEGPTTTLATTTTTELGGEGGGGLPSTGSGQGILIVLGSLMVLAGAVTMVLARRPDEV